MMTREEIVRKAAAIPAEERPVPQSRLSGLGDFLGIYGGEHIAATEFVIGALLVTWGVRAKELLFGLVVGNLLATCMYAFCTAPIAVDTRLSLFAYLRKAAGPCSRLPKETSMPEPLRIGTTSSHTSMQADFT